MTIVGTLIGLLAANHFTSQIGLYADGVCQAQMYRSLEDADTLMPEARTFIIQNVSRKHNNVLKRLTHNRRRIDDSFGFQFVINPDEGSMPAERDETASLRLIMLQNCTIVPARS